MFCRMFSSCIIIHQCENSQNFQYSHQSCMPNIGGQNSDHVTYWIPPLEITNSRETKSSYTLATADPAKWHFSGKVTAFNAMWCVCLRSGWQGNIQAGILDPMGLFLSQVTGHMSRNTFPTTPAPFTWTVFISLFPLPYGILHSLTKVIADFGDNLNERLCSNCLLNTNPSDK